MAKKKKTTKAAAVKKKKAAAAKKKAAAAKKKAAAAAKKKKAAVQALEAAGLSSSLEPMSTRQYLQALDALGLTVAGKSTAEALGLSLRQCQRIAGDLAPVPRPVELLLKMYLHHGMPR